MYHYPRDCIHNEAYAVMNRVLVNTPDLVDTTGWAEFRDQIVACSTLFKPVGFEHYSGSKRSRYVNVMNTSLNNQSNEARGFLKVQKAECLGVVKPDRMIQFHQVVLNVAFMDHYKSIEEEFYKREYNGLPCIAKGHNLVKRGAVIADHWGSNPDCVAIDFDFEKMDAHTKQHKMLNEQEVTDILMGVYYGNGDEKTVVITKNGLKYYVFIRTSGHFCTSINTTTYCVWVHEMDLKKNCPDATFYCDGDDFVVFCSRANLKNILVTYAAFYRDRGLTCGIERIAYDIRNIKFCQCSPIRYQQGWVMVRHPMKVLGTLLFTQRHPATNKTYFATVAECLWRAAPGVPIVGVLQQAMMKWSRKRMELTGEDCYMERRVAVDQGPHTVEDCYVAFGLDVVSVRYWESVYTNLRCPTKEVDLTIFPCPCGGSM